MNNDMLRWWAETDSGSWNEIEDGPIFVVFLEQCLQFHWYILHLELFSVAIPIVFGLGWDYLLSGKNDELKCVLMEVKSIYIVKQQQQ